MDGGDDKKSKWTCANRRQSDRAHQAQFKASEMTWYFVCHSVWKLLRDQALKHIRINISWGSTLFLAVRYPPNFTVAPRRALTFLPIHFRLLRKSKAKSLSLSCRCMCSFPCETTPVLFDQQHKEQFTYEHTEHYAHQTHTFCWLCSFSALKRIHLNNHSFHLSQHTIVYWRWVVFCIVFGEHAKIKECASAIWCGNNIHTTV